MARVKRRKKNSEDNKVNHEDLILKHIRERKFGYEEIKTYAEEVVEVLGILESKGIDIYAKGRYGGMHLKKAKNQETQKHTLLNNIFQNNKKTKTINNDKQAGILDKNQLASLFNKK